MMMMMMTLMIIVIGMMMMMIMIMIVTRMVGDFVAVVVMNFLGEKEVFFRKPIR